MNALLVLAIAVVVTVAAEIVLPGRTLYHAGWFNVALAAFALIAVVAARKPWRAAATNLQKGAVIAVAFGTAVAGFAGVASGLLAPDNRTIVGAPGQRVRVDDLGGFLNFPLTQAEPGSPPQAVVLERPGHAAFPIAGRARDAGTFVLQTTPRQVVYVEARDLHGGRLTVTQPSGSAFLSPVLLMQQHQTIQGLDVPFDSFAVPAAHRLVKAVLFDARQAATLGGTNGAAVPAVLFAVDDENDRPLRNAIALAPDGQTVNLAGIALHAGVIAYPAVDIFAAPALAAVIAAALLVAGGLVAYYFPFAARRGTVS